MLSMLLMLVASLLLATCYIYIYTTWFIYYLLFSKKLEYVFFSFYLQ